MLFFDIETAPIVREIEFLTKEKRESWLRKNIDWSNAGLFAEFGQIVCFSYAEDAGEPNTLTDIKEINKLISKYDNVCGWNIKNFDIPFLSKHFYKNRLPIPQSIKTNSVKPWESKIIDLMELWRFGNWQGNTSLNDVSLFLGIETPKKDFSGKDVQELFFSGEIEKIKKYCERDVKCLQDIYYFNKTRPVCL